MGPLRPYQSYVSSLDSGLGFLQVNSVPSLWSLTGYWKGLILTLNSSSFLIVPDVPGPEEQSELGLTANPP